MNLQRFQIAVAGLVVCFSPVAFSADNPVASKGLEITAAPKSGTNAAPYHKVFVLAVGVGKYPRAQDRLDYARSDAQKVAAAFGEKYSFTVTKQLLDEQATRENILGELDSIGKQLAGEQQDDFIIYFSGHGTTADEKVMEDGQERRRRHGFLLPYSEKVSLADKDYSTLTNYALPLRELVDKVIGMKGARHRILFLDSCFSGLAFKDQKVLAKFPDDPYEQVLRKPSIQLITAGLDSQAAYEDARLKQSIFTDALLRQLEMGSVRTMEEIFLPLRIQVRDYFEGQKTARMMTPQHRYLVHDEGTFVFVPPTKYATWSGNAPLMMAAAGPVRGKGGELEGPVPEAELNELKNKRYEFSDQELAAKKERYEYRASIGDPLATVAIAEMYRLGLGVKRDPARSQVWAAEAADAANATPDRAMQQALAIVGALHGGGVKAGGVSPGGIAGIMSAFDKSGLESFRDVSKELQKKLEEFDRSDAMGKLKELREIFKNDIVEEGAGKITAADSEGIRALLNLIETEVGFGAFESARETLAETVLNLSRLSAKIKPNTDEQNKPRKFGPFGIPL